MKHHKLRNLLRAAALGSLLTVSLSASAATFYQIQGVTSATAATDLFNAQNLIEGPGVGFNPEEPYERISGSTWVTNAPNGSTGNYFDPLPNPAPRLIFDLGADTLLGEISIWGYANGIEGNSMKDFSLRFATDAEGFDGFGTSIAYNPTFSAGPEVTRHSFPFGQTVTARYVELTPLSNNIGLGPGGDRVGFSEVAFEAVPEPSASTVLMAAGGLLLVGRSRRTRPI